MKFELPKLPYALDDLEPNISEQTLIYHYGKHHQAYINNLNSLIEGTDFINNSLEEIVKKSDGAIFNNAAQVWNHSFYFAQFNPSGDKIPKGNLLEKIKSDFGSFESFKEQFEKATMTLFGSGWVWLVIMPEGELKIVQTSNAATPIISDPKPILVCDVWEHAYYLDYQNRRDEYLSGFWKIFDWSIAEDRLESY